MPEFKSIPPTPVQRASDIVMLEQIDARKTIADTRQQSQMADEDSQKKVADLAGNKVYYAFQALRVVSNINALIYGRDF
ncbi:hypothetical protein CNMCM6457_005572 [Aspergillus fumigatiaffinis]|nr:hypothetical protein CNMCM6457_005572 [Aspergillus fumigatiaffinis]